MKIRRVTKRDGRTVPFDRQKIASAVRRAQAAVGQDDESAAEDVADVVELALARRYLNTEGEALPGIEEIQDLVEQALVELGHAAVAKAYILYRDRRARVRAALQSRSDALAAEGGVGEGAPRPVRGPRVQVSGGIETWKKSRITAALLEEADLPRERAEEVAARVEERVFALGVKQLSTALIRELVDNELVELGLSNALRRQRPVGLPRHDLRRILGTHAERATRDAHAASGADVVERVAGEVLRRFALEDVLGPASAEHHLAGEIHVEDLERPHEHLESAVPCDLLLRGDVSVRSAFDLMEDLGDLARGAARGVVLEDPWTICQVLARARGGALPSFLAALGGLARATGRRVDVSFAAVSARGNAPSAAATAVLARVCEELAELEDEGRLRALPRLFLDAGEIVRLAAGTPTLARTLDVHLARGRVVPTFGSGRVRFAAPALRRAARERGVLHAGGVVALNLPRAARRAGAWREDAFFEHLATTVECALDALHELREFQRGASARAGELRGRTSYALVPVGLREALRWLADGEVRPDQGARALGFLAEATERFAQARSLSVALVPACGERAAARFADLDAERFPVEQPLLFDGVGAARRDGTRRASGGEPYGVGFELAAAEPGPASTSGVLGAGLATVLAALDAGTLEPPSLLRSLSSGPAPVAQPCLDALERLERARARSRSGAHALYVLPRGADDADVAGEAPSAGALDAVDLVPRFRIPNLYPDDPEGPVPARASERSETSRFES